uniref:Uncharacterized protein n=1 Tax=Setaria italica TaxID=4555 RepID=K3XP29_SETIT
MGMPELSSNVDFNDGAGDRRRGGCGSAGTEATRKTPNVRRWFLQRKENTAIHSWIDIFESEIEI